MRREDENPVVVHRGRGTVSGVKTVLVAELESGALLLVRVTRKGELVDRVSGRVLDPASIVLRSVEVADPCPRRARVRRAA